MNALWKGNPRYPLILERVLTESQGRLIILSGEAGIGKTTLCLQTIARIYGEHFLTSSNFQFFRPDEYAMKLAFFLQYSSPSVSRHINTWGVQFLSHLSQLLALKEIKNRQITYQKRTQSLEEFSTLIMERLRSDTLSEALFSDKEFQKHLLSLAEEISKKKTIPIAFVHRVIHFHQYKSTEPRVTFIGGWENATPEAQNASLKLFEELPASSRIILHTNALENVLPTIVSRSLVISLPPLTSAMVSEILNQPSSFSSCVLHMRETLFHEHSQATHMATLFFNDLGWKIQYNDEIFDFVQQICATPTMVESFLDALMEVLREAWLTHQKEIRQRGTEHASLAFVPYTSEVSEWMQTITSTRNLITKSTMQPTYLLTDLLISLARWIQKRKRP